MKTFIGKPSEVLLLALAVFAVAIPVNALASSSASAIACGDSHSVALRLDGTVWKWGANYYWGGVYTNARSPAQISGLNEIVAVAAGGGQSFALKSNGTVWGWGNNADGELGDGTMTDRLVPVQVVGLTGVVSVKCGEFHTLALRSDGTVWAWGWNGEGELGSPPTNDGLSTTPMQVSELGGVVAVAGGAHYWGYSLALKSDGTVWAWGENGEGELGRGTINPPYGAHPVPAQVVGLTGVVAVAGGGGQCLALKSDGTVWAWGWNNLGQLGDGTTNNRATPVQVVGLTGVLAVAAGGSHSLALKSDGTVWTWGLNLWGRLGDGTTNNRAIPVKVVGLTGAVAVAGTGYGDGFFGNAGSSLALKSDGTVWAWGLNYYGELGDGTTNNSSIPVQVIGLSGVFPINVTPPANVTTPQNTLSIYPPLPARQPGKNNLVLVTHGWNGEMTWVNEMAAVISNRLASTGMTDWQVAAYDWTQWAGGWPDSVLNNAVTIGRIQVGPQIVQQGWQHVHLIGHSAGTGLIQEAADVIHSNAPSTFVHTTFLDPYQGVNGWYAPRIGNNASLADNYFSRDALPFTEGGFSNTFNVDVTWLCPEAAKGIPAVGTNCYGAFIGDIPDAQGHAWPHVFYSESVTNQSFLGSVPYGFRLSVESGIGGVVPENNEPETPGGGLVCPVHPPILPSQLNTSLDFSQLLNPFSSFGANVSGTSFNLTNSSSQQQPNNKTGIVAAQDSGSVTNTSVPAWLAVEITVTSGVNFVQFDSQFTDGNSAQGLLTVYWNDDVIGTVDERAVSLGLQTYRFFLSSAATNGVNILSFRLDSFYGTSSSITVANIATGFAGITQPTTLGIVQDVDGSPLLKLTGASNYNYLVQCSTNLVDWSPMALVASTNGAVLFPDPDWTNYNARFYRTLLP